MQVPSEAREVRVIKNCARSELSSITFCSMSSRHSLNTCKMASALRGITHCRLISSVPSPHVIYEVGATVGVAVVGVLVGTRVGLVVGVRVGQGQFASHSFLPGVIELHGTNSPVSQLDE